MAPKGLYQDLAVSTAEPQGVVHRGCVEHLPQRPWWEKEKVERYNERSDM